MSDILIPRAEDILAAKPGYSYAELKALAVELYREGTLDHIPISWVSAGLVEKWHPDKMAYASQNFGAKEFSRDELYRLGLAPAEITEDAPSNNLVNNGITRLLDRLVGTASTASYANGTARIGTGNSTTAFAATQTDLQAAAGATNRFFQACASTYPSVSAQTMTAQSTFGTSDGNYAWEEWGIDGGGASGTTVGTNSSSNCALLNRKVTTLGTKASGSSWTLTSTIVIS